MRTWEEIARSGDLDHMGYREMLDMARELGIRPRGTRRSMLNALKTVCIIKGWIPKERNSR